MENPKFSVIIPCYNSEHTVSYSLDSVLAQSFTDYEVIVVNDGSVDNTKDVILTYCDRYPQVSLISKGNSGVSTARNRGLEAAKGDYIFFLDSDDTLEPYALQMLAAVSSKNDFDIIIFGYRELVRSRIYERKIPQKFNNDPLNAFLRGKININIWSLVARKTCYDQLPVIRFDAKTYFSEDDEVVVKLLSRTQKVGYCRDLLYRFQPRPVLVDPQHYTEKHFSAILAWKRIYESVKENASAALSRSAYNRWVYIYLKHYLFCMENQDNRNNLGRLKDYEDLIRRFPPFQLTRFGLFNFFQVLLYKTSNENI